MAGDRLVLTGAAHDADIAADWVATYDTRTGVAGPRVELQRGRGYTATALRDGRVLFAGGDSGQPDPEDDFWSLYLDDAVVYDPDGGAVEASASRMQSRRLDHTATLLADGRVLLVGGLGSDRDGGETNTADIFDPSTRRFVPTGSMAEPRAGHQALLLKDGRVLVIGGWADDGVDTWAVRVPEMYSPARGKFSQIRSLSSLPPQLAAAVLPDGRVLFAGGLDPKTKQPTAGPRSTTRTRRAASHRPAADRPRGRDRGRAARRPRADHRRQGQGRAGPRQRRSL